MPPEQIFRLARDENGKATRVQVDPDMTVGRTDQILTTPLFGLKTTLDRATQEGIKRYQELIGKIRRSHEEEKQFQKLRKILQFRIPPASGSLGERRAHIKARENLVRNAKE